MEIIHQELESSTSTIKAMAKRNSGLSAIYNKIRKQDKTSYFGDTIIFTKIINTLADIGMSKNRSEIAYALRKIEELKDWTKVEKTEFLDVLFNILHATEIVKSKSVRNQNGDKKS